MQTTRREIDSFVSRKSFKYNDVIDSKIVNLDIWHHFRFLDELSRKLESSINSRLISDWVRMLKSSIQVKSEDWYQVLELSQKIDIETRLNDQSNFIQEKSKFNDFYSMFQRLFFYLKYHEKQLIIDLQDKIVYHLHAA